MARRSGDSVVPFGSPDPVEPGA